MKSLSVTIQMKATEQFFPVVLSIMLYKVVLTYEYVDEILKCDHSNEREQYLLVVLFVFNLIMRLSPARLNDASYNWTKAKHTIQAGMKAPCGITASLTLFENNQG